MAANITTTTLYRPVGQAELDLIAAELEAFNDAIVGAIEVISEHRAGTAGSGAREP